MTDRLAFITARDGLETDQREGEALVFLHGFGGVAAQWQGWLNSFAPHIKTLAFDLPGHGASLDYPGFGPPKVAARAVLADTADMGFERLHLVGHSMGGAIASLMALFAPDRIASMTLLAPGGYGPGINHGLLTRWAGASEREEIATLLPNFFGPDYEIHTKLVDFTTTARQRENLTDRLQEIAKGLARDGVQGQLPVDDIMALDIPKAVIWGTHDHVLPVDQAYSLQLMADQGLVSLHIVNKMGHSPAEEARGLVTEIIQGHLGL
ncbi:MAG: alpha/beta fold hydrolase [Pseudomonadota bacterium]